MISLTHETIQAGAVKDGVFVGWTHDQLAILGISITEDHNPPKGWKKKLIKKSCEITEEEYALFLSKTQEPSNTMKSKHLGKVKYLESVKPFLPEKRMPRYVAVKKVCYYCYDCLGKFRGIDLIDCKLCPNCLVEARNLNNKKIRAAVVTRLRQARGLPSIKKRKKKNNYEDVYLKSSLWKMIKARVLVRDRGICQACSSKAQVVHHKSYDRLVLDGLRDSELISLCNSCHRKIEFNFVDGEDIKNSLEEANKKLFVMMSKT